MPSNKWSFGKLERRITVRMNRSQKRLWESLVFLVRFTILAGALHFLVWLNLDFAGIISLTAASVEAVIKPFIQDYIRVGSVFVIETVDGTLTAEIVRDCVGWKSFMALAGLIFAVRGVDMRKRLAGLAAGIPLIFIGNVARLSSTFIITQREGAAVFDSLHGLLWKWGLVALVLVLWYIWLEWARRRPKKGLKGQ